MKTVTPKLSPFFLLILKVYVNSAFANILQYNRSELAIPGVDLTEDLYRNSNKDTKHFDVSQRHSIFFLVVNEEMIQR